MTLSSSHPESESQPGLLRQLGTRDSIGLLIAVTIGAGIYSTPQRIAGLVGSASTVLWLWLFVGLVTTTGVLLWAELATRLPVAGGNFVYLRRTMGKHAAFLFGWKSLILTSPANRAALSLVAADYIAALVPLAEAQRLWVAIAVLIGLGTLNYVGVRAAANFQNLTALFKVLALSGFVLIGFRALLTGPSRLSTSAAPTSELAPLGGMAIACILIFFSYTGWSRLGDLAEEIRDPRRSIPRTALIAFPFLIALFVALNAVYHGVLGLEGVRASDVVVADVARDLVGPWGGDLAAFLIVVSVTGGMSALIMANSRLFLAMAREKAFFGFLDHVHPHFHTPSRAVVLHIGFSLVLLLVKRNFTDLVTTSTFLNILLYALRSASIFSLRRRQVGEQHAYRMPLYPWLPILFIAFLSALFVIRLIYDWDRAWFDLVLLALGVPASVAWHRWFKS